MYRSAHPYAPSYALSLASHLYARLFSGHGLHVHDHDLSDSVAVEAVETVAVGEVVLGIVAVVGEAVETVVVEVVVLGIVVAEAGFETVEEAVETAVGLGIEAAAPGIVGLGTVVAVVAVVVDIDWD